MISNYQAVRDVVASHDTLIHLFERINFFLQRLKTYTEIPFANELTELLGKIMAQLLSVLALSTKAMTDRKISESIRSLCFLLADRGPEKILKKLVGRKDIEDALLQLDMLTNEESLMVVVRNLKITHHVDDNVKATKVLTEDIDNNTKATKVLIEDVDDNVKGIEGIARSVDNGTPNFLSVFMYIVTLFPAMSEHSHTRA